MSAPVEHFDVLIVGAGLSGVGAGVHLHENCPGKTYAILEGRAAMGGTWDLFRYPGIRSDSDMHTLGYSFKPWTDAKSIADGPSIRKYVNEAAAEYGVDKHIRFHHKVKSASWSSVDARWAVEAERTDTGETVKFTAGFLHMCSGYYSYSQGYTPDFEGLKAFKGQIVHPQAWPEDLDYSGKRVVVIGSGATAMTLVPAMSADAAHITMLQRSPTYVVSRPAEDAMANALRRWLPAQWAYNLTRFRNTTLQQFMYRRMRAKPEQAKTMLLDMVKKELGPDYDVDTHFTPSYFPWDQRLCLVPNGDLFEAIRSGKASVVTDHIDTFTAKGIKLKSGETLEADIIVTATGLNMVVLGEVKFAMDGAPVDFSKLWTYKGMMYSGLPNMASVFGYINASWTLRADLLSLFVCRLLNHMDKVGAASVTPRLRATDQDMAGKPWIDGFSSGYFERGIGQFPKQGDREPWVNPQNYSVDRKMFLNAPIDDGVLAFEAAPAKPVKSSKPAKPALQAAE